MGLAGETRETGSSTSLFLSTLLHFLQVNNESANLSAKLTKLSVKGILFFLGDVACSVRNIELVANLANRAFGDTQISSKLVDIVFFKALNNI